MSRADDLSGLLRPAPAPNVGLRQGTVVTFNPSTGANTVSVAGAVLTNLPLLNIGDTVNVLPGDVVVLARYGNSWAILGRLIVPGSAALNQSAVGFDTAGNNASNFSVSTSLVTKLTITLDVPTWANRAAVIAFANASIFNTGAAAQNYICTIEADGNSSGSVQTLADVGQARALTTNGVWFLTPGGSTISVAARFQATAAIPAHASNNVNLGAIGAFSKV